MHYPGAQDDWRVRASMLRSASPDSWPKSVGRPLLAYGTAIQALRIGRQAITIITDMCAGDSSPQPLSDSEQ